MWSTSNLLCLCAAILQLSVAHICIITPRQRGPFDIATRGSHTCTRHEFPCGGQAPQKPPLMQLEGGRPVFIKWQQNLNHYSIGNPGYMDLGFATGAQVADVTRNTSLPDPFKMIAIVEDRHEYAQDHQRNYTAILTLPNVDCDHCVIRARYESRKPGETQFYQCADVTIRKSSLSELVDKKGHVQLLSQEMPKPKLMSVLKNENSKTNTSDARIENLLEALDMVQKQKSVRPVRSANSMTIYGFANDVSPARGAQLVAFDTVTGTSQQVAPLSFRLDSPFYNNNPVSTQYPNTTIDFITDSVMSLDSGKNTLVIPMNTHNSMDRLTDVVVELNARSGVLTSRYNVSYDSSTPPLKSGFSSVHVEIESTYVTFNLEKDAKNTNTYRFVVGRLYAGGAWRLLSKSQQTESDYVNFLWADYDISVKTLYVLLGNEGDTDRQTARLYKFFIMPEGSNSQSTNDQSFVELNVSKFPFMGFHFHPFHSNLLFAVSPGLFGVTYPSYHLVTVDVDSGHVQDLMEIAPAGIFESFYGGTVAGGLNPSTNQFVHVLRIANTNADVIVTVDPFKKSTFYSPVTNLRHVFSLYTTY